jgi:prepilin-type N-terminal cleavage/methylation domain-containing protein
MCERASRRSQRGFSLIELLIVILILTVIMGAIFNQIELVQQRAVTEQAKLDMFQQAREFMDQLSRDLHQAGFPGVEVFSTANSHFVLNPANPQSPFANNSIVAVGLTKIDSGDLWFEGDVDGSGQVSVVHYHYDASGTNCPCLKRSVQTPKISADPLSQQTPVYSVEVQNVQNGDSSSNPIFYAYAHGSGTALSLPLDFDANPKVMASIDTIQIVLTVQSPIPDPKTQLKPITTLVSTVRLPNCSSAYPGQANSCQ